MEKNRKLIVILGAGESGVGAALLAVAKGMDVFVSDAGNIAERYKQELEAHGISYEEGGHSKWWLEQAVEVIKSPGIADETPVMKEVKACGIPVISEIEFAGRYTQARMICVTGSNGKTTTVSLVYHILKAAGVDVALAGNVGCSLARQVAAGDHACYVVELSSFQLEGMYDFRAHVAVLLNVSPDHLDRYGGEMMRYVDAKLRIVQNQQPGDALVYWADDPIIGGRLKEKASEVEAALYPFAAETGERDVAAWTDGEKLYWDRPVAFNMELEDLALTGVHNYYNSMAAGLSALVSGVRSDVIREALGTFKGVEHRLEKVGMVKGVEFINDSKATNVNSAWYALHSMTKPTILILGGKDKGNDYAEIIPLVKEKCKALVYMGLHNEKLHSVFDPLGLPVHEVHSMVDAVNAAYGEAVEGDVVLLSPCCASFDLFTSYEDRGQKFKACVEELRNR
ncbi:MAG: UDP-N-acetylmuramoyl-L-alanine--D-glutamate ligase [Bacteroidaceae bacterium]|nr:UDP-N-acetylmuramoyl-L-alanine--D-glutamate ligase [Bacteroidaceae bacterium]